MAMARCRIHKPSGQGKPNGNSYLGPPREPWGDGEAIICGEPTCESPAKIWLESVVEEPAYEKSKKRVFDLQSYSNGKVRVR